MALRNQPYLPLYVQDVLTDEKLVLCSAQAHGIYFRLICMLHKEETYGFVSLKQKFSKSESKYKNFASQFSLQMPFEQKEIEEALIELHEMLVIEINEMSVSQKRMVRDGELSLLRAEAGKKGGCGITKQYGQEGFVYIMTDGYEKTKIGISKNPQGRLYRLRSDLKLPKHFHIFKAIPVHDMGAAEDFSHNFFGEKMDGEWLIGSFKDFKNDFDLLEANLKQNLKKDESKSEANTEYENANENENENDKRKGKRDSKGKKEKPNSLIEVEEFFAAFGAMDWTPEIIKDEAETFWNHFNSNGWKVGGKTPMKDWQSAAKNWIKRSTPKQMRPTQPSKFQTNLGALTAALPMLNQIGGGHQNGNQ